MFLKKLSNHYDIVFLESVTLTTRNEELSLVLHIELEICLKITSVTDNQHYNITFHKINRLKLLIILCVVLKIQ